MQPAQAALGLPAVPPGPVPGYVLVADRNNNRVLIVSPAGRVVWQFPRPGDLKAGQTIRDPDDAFFTPGYTGISTNEEFNDQLARISLRKRQVVRTYGPGPGPGALDRPSLAVRWPNGMIAVTDDWHHRIVVIDPRTKQIVWQCGHPGVASAAPGYLSKPDGLDLLPSAIARSSAVSRVRVVVTRIGSLPQPASRIAAVALSGGRVMAMGGLVSGTSSSWILAGPPSRLRQVGRLPMATHDAAAAAIGGRVYLFGGGESTSSPAIVAVDGAGRARRAGTIGEPLSDLGAVSIGKAVYLVGAHTGSRYATAILRFRPGRVPSVVVRLPTGVRYAGVAALDGQIYVAGGVTTSGTNSLVYAVDPRSGTVTQVADLPAPTAHAPLVAVAGALYLVGGADGASRAVSSILRIDPRTGGVGRIGRLPQPLADAAAARLGSSIVVLGGAGSASSNGVLRLEISRRAGG